MIVCHLPLDFVKEGGRQQGEQNLVLPLQFQVIGRRRLSSRAAMVGLPFLPCPVRQAIGKEECYRFVASPKFLAQPLCFSTCHLAFFFRTSANFWTVAQFSSITAQASRISHRRKAISLPSLNDTSPDQFWYAAFKVSPVVVLPSRKVFIASLLLCGVSAEVHYENLNTLGGVLRRKNHLPFCIGSGARSLRCR